MFDSRVIGNSHPLGGQRPKINIRQVLGEPVEQIYCINCGTPGGYISASLPKGVESSHVIYLCPACEDQTGPLPLPVLHLKES